MAIQRKQHPKNADTQILLSPNTDAPVLALNMDALVLSPLNMDTLALLSSPANAQTPTPQSIHQTWTLALHTKSGSTMNSYPDMVTETNWAKATWKAGCKEKDVDMVPNVNHLCIIIHGPHRSQHDLAIFMVMSRPRPKTRWLLRRRGHKSVSSRFNGGQVPVTWFKGAVGLAQGDRIKDRVDLLVSQKRRTMMEKQRRKRNTKVPCDELKSSRVKASTTQVVIERQYRAKGCDRKWDKAKLGAFPSFYRRLNTMECTLNEWRTGSYSPLTFTVADYKHVFEDAHEMLQCFDQATKDLGILPVLQKAIFTGGWSVSITFK
ncbi:hypothetical protein F5148DRAFT_1147466 [Russula earlei]|uniref:Uncharacterized protein n=1 Tax=Russula earlei TaxID=71964 RepID=A0ACC0UFY4_9AGAM|nr:hypothetical protein F5148DRAFT_1147466 [Russula earlei]